MVDENKKIISFGFGGRGELKREYDLGQDEESGEEMVKFIFVPYNDYISIYNPQSEEYKNIDAEDCLKAIVPKRLIVRENRSTQTESIKVLCGPKGEETEYTRLHQELLFELKNRDSTLLLKEKEIAKLKNDLEKSTAPTKFKKIIEEASFAGARQAILETKTSK